MIKRFNDRVALTMTKGIGNMWFFWALTAFIVGWMLVIGGLVGDPYPWALMLLIVGGIFQALAMVAIMVGQNLLSDSHEDIHAKLDAVHQHLGISDGLQ